jgi:hypothetical protein
MGLDIQSKIKELDALALDASGGTWQSDEYGLYITTDDCPLCTPRRRKLAKDEMGNMVTSAPTSLDEDEKHLIEIRGWGHLQRHPKGEGVQKANAKFIAAAHNSWPEISAYIEMLEKEVFLAANEFDSYPASYDDHSLLESASSTLRAMAQLETQFNSKWNT